MQTIRFQQDVGALPKGVYRRYVIKDRGGENLVIDIPATRLRGETRIGEALLRSEGRGWTLLDADGTKIATVSSRKLTGSGWTVDGPGLPTLEFLDRTVLPKEVMRSALGGSPDGYCCLADGAEIGTLTREPRTKTGNGMLGRLKRLVATHDWVFNADELPKGNMQFPIIAGQLAIIEVTVPAVRSA